MWFLQTPQWAGMAASSFLLTDNGQTLCNLATDGRDPSHQEPAGCNKLEQRERGGHISFFPRKEKIDGGGATNVFEAGLLEAGQSPVLGLRGESPGLWALDPPPNGLC